MAVAVEFGGQHLRRAIHGAAVQQPRQCIEACLFLLLGQHGIHGHQREARQASEDRHKGGQQAQLEQGIGTQGRHWGAGFQHRIQAAALRQQLQAARGQHQWTTLAGQRDRAPQQAGQGEAGGDGGHHVAGDFGQAAAAAQRGGGQHGRDGKHAGSERRGCRRAVTGQRYAAMDQQLGGHAQGRRHQQEPGWPTERVDHQQASRAGQHLAGAPSAAHGACAQSQHQGSEDDLRGGEQDKQCHHGSARI